MGRAHLFAGVLGGGCRLRLDTSRNEHAVWPTERLVHLCTSMGEWADGWALLTSGTPSGRRPPKMIASTGTPAGSSQRGWMIGHWPAGAVKRLFGCDDTPGSPIFHGSPNQLVIFTFCIVYSFQSRTITLSGISFSSPSQ